MKTFSAEKKRIQQAEIGREITAVGVGVVKGEINDSNVKITLSNVLLVPSMGFNILSVKKLCSNGYKVIFYENMCKVENKCGDTLFMAHKKDGLYQIVIKMTNNAGCILNQIKIRSIYKI